MFIELPLANGGWVSLDSTEIIAYGQDKDRDYSYVMLRRESPTNNVLVVDFYIGLNYNDLKARLNDVLNNSY